MLYDESYPDLPKYFDKYQWAEGVWRDVFWVLGFRQSDFHFHHSGISLVPQDGMMLSYTSCFIAGDQHLTIVYVRPVNHPAFLCGFALMALQKSSNDGGVLNREDRSVWTVGALGTSVMAIQIVSVR